MTFPEYMNNRYIKSIQYVLNTHISIEHDRDCHTCRNKITVVADERNGDICKCDLMGIDGIVNGQPLSEEIRDCPFWSRDAGVYELYKETVNDFSNM